MNGIEEFTPEWFDASSAAWNLNKRRVGASYVYVCTEPLCKRKVVSHKDTCVKHCVRQTSRYTRHPLLLERNPLIVRKMPRGPAERQVGNRETQVGNRETQVGKRHSARLLQKRHLSHSIAERVLARRRL